MTADNIQRYVASPEKRPINLSDLAAERRVLVNGLVERTLDAVFSQFPDLFIKPLTYGNENSTAENASANYVNAGQVAQVALKPSVASNQTYPMAASFNTQPPAAQESTPANTINTNSTAEQPLNSVNDLLQQPAGYDHDLFKQQAEAAVNEAYEYGSAR